MREHPQPFPADQVPEQQAEKQPGYSQRAAEDVAFIRGLGQGRQGLFGFKGAYFKNRYVGGHGGHVDSGAVIPAEDAVRNIFSTEYQPPVKIPLRRHGSDGGRLARIGAVPSEKLSGYIDPVSGDGRPAAQYPFRIRLAGGSGIFVRKNPRGGGCRRAQRSGGNPQGGSFSGRSPGQSARNRIVPHCCKSPWLSFGNTALQVGEAKAEPLVFWGPVSAHPRLRGPEWKACRNPCSCLNVPVRSR